MVLRKGCHSTIHQLINPFCHLHTPTQKFSSSRSEQSSAPAPEKSNIDVYITQLPRQIKLYVHLAKLEISLQHTCRTRSHVKWPLTHLLVAVCVRSAAGLAAGHNAAWPLWLLSRPATWSEYQRTAPAMLYTHISKTNSDKINIHTLCRICILYICVWSTNTYSPVHIL